MLKVLGLAEATNFKHKKSPRVETQRAFSVVRGLGLCPNGAEERTHDVVLGKHLRCVEQEHGRDRERLPTLTVSEQRHETVDHPPAGESHQKPGEQDTGGQGFDRGQNFHGCLLYLKAVEPTMTMARNTRVATVMRGSYHHGRIFFI